MLPNLFIIGASKSGTTSLHRYLDLHPQVAMSTQKELRLFQRADWRERLGWYEAQFTVDAQIRGESSPIYSWHPYRPGVPGRIHALAPEAKLIYMVRDPIDRIVAQYVHLYAIGDRTPFERYISEYDRPDNRLVCPSRYATQVDQYMKLFPRGQLLVVDQHDLKVRRADVLREVFGFLGIDAGFHSHKFEAEHNKRTELHALTRVGHPLWQRVLGPISRRFPERARESFTRHAIGMLSRPITDYPVIEPGQRERVAAALQDEVDRLRDFTGKRFASWSL